MWVSGSGKSTVMKELLSRDPSLVYVPSCTTRDPRAGESQGSPYFFLTKAEFEKEIQQDSWLEYAFVHQMSYYGTRKQPILDALKNGQIPIKEFDMNGLRALLENGNLDRDQFATIFLDIDDATIRERIMLRGGSPEQEIQKRIASAEREREGADALCDRVLYANRSVDEMVDAVQETIAVLQNSD